MTPKIVVSPTTISLEPFDSKAFKLAGNEISDFSLRAYPYKSMTYKHPTSNQFHEMAAIFLRETLSWNIINISIN